MARKARPTPHSPISREDVLAYLRERAGPASVGDLARAFGVKGKDRTALRLLMRELEDEGLIESPRRRKFSARDALRPTMVLEITGPDADGELRARPVRWPEGEEPPVIFVIPLRARVPAPGAGERILARISENEDGTYTARTLRHLGAAPLEVIGVVRESAGAVRIEPTDRRAKYDYGVRRADLRGAGPGELVRARVLPERSGGLRGVEVVERIGRLDTPGAIGVIALHANRIPIPFPEAAVAEAEAAVPAELGSRTDLRTTPLVTIDDEDARDFDDAVFAEPDSGPANPGGFKLIVAIADVAWYVRPGSNLDGAARTRGNSVYLPDRVVPMLPEALSAGLCSLKPEEDRAALAATLAIDADGELIGHRFERVLMRSAARLTYRQVQAIREGTDAVPDGLRPSAIEHLYAAHAALDAARRRRGTLDLDLPEYKVTIGKTGRIERITARERLTSHRLIEEFMIAANVAAAETLEKHRAPCMYRVHEPPDAARVESLRTFLASFGLELPRGQVIRARQLAGLLEKASADPSADVIHEAVLRCQSQAAYSPANKGHFGLALRRYAHFTSPIRRYADLLVHRALIEALGLGPGALGGDGAARFEDTALHISDTERRAQAAEREALDRYLALYLEDRVGGRFAARIAGVTRFGLFVRLRESGADGLVPLSLLGVERFEHDEDTHTLEGLSSGTVYTLGDDVEVELREASALTGSLVFTITEHRPARRARRPRRPRSGRPGPKAGTRGRSRGTGRRRGGKAPGPGRRRP